MSKGTIQLTIGQEVVTPKGAGIVEAFESRQVANRVGDLRGRPVTFAQVSGLKGARGQNLAKPVLFRLNVLRPN